MCVRSSSLAVTISTTSEGLCFIASMEIANVSGSSSPTVSISLTSEGLYFTTSMDTANVGTMSSSPAPAEEGANSKVDEEYKMGHHSLEVFCFHSNLLHDEDT